MAQFREEFVPNGGFRWYRGGSSILTQAFSFGWRLSSQENLAYARAVYQFLDGVSPRAPIDYQSGSVLIGADFPEVSDAEFYKYLSHGTWGYVKDGSFQFGSAAYYRSTPNMNIRDEREGAGTFHLTSGPQQLNMTLTSGFDAAIFCGTGGIGDRALIHKKFGERLIRIRPVRRFAELVARRIGARNFEIRDVIYTDFKSYQIELPGINDAIDILRAENPRGDLTERSGHKLNKRFFEQFHRIGKLPSLFTKPRAYAVERERRIIFDLPRDLDLPQIRLSDPSLLKFIEVI
jgi:hypothetical protein